MVVRKTRSDFAEELYSICANPQRGGATKFSSQHSTWFSILAQAVQNTDTNDVTRGDWTRALASAIVSAGIQWMPGSSRRTLTSQRIVELVGEAPSRAMVMLATQPRSLKRKALEAEQSRAALSTSLAKRTRYTINFEKPLPFKTVPDIVCKGFDRIEGKAGEGPARNHYIEARACLNACLGQPLCNLMLMLAVTFSECTVTPCIPEKERSFTAAKVKKDSQLLAATMVTRMLWYLRPQDFPADADARGVLCVKKMTTKIGSSAPLVRPSLLVVSCWQC